jgi:predicted dehydrogenase/threonine dehydrogenase-like Zn-dependent dehydrogenase
MVLDLASKSLLAKARERPDQVRQVLQKIKTQGLLTTWKQVQERLHEPMPLGYSSAGVVLACGAGVQEFKPGDRVASNGGHAGVVSVPKRLVAAVPEGVSWDQAAFTVVAAIALQGVRLANLALGDTVLVIGLGLIGQIAVKLLKLQGARVLGTDLDPDKCRLAVQLGADEASPTLSGEAVFAKTRGIGADAVLITAATKSDGPIALAAEAVRAKGRVVAVGAVGLNLPRRPFYFKEAEFVVSCSYGPGRYDPEYEARGHDYPVGYVRWTEQRNMQAILDLLGTGRLDLSPLITHRFPIENAAVAYDLIRTGSEPYLGIVLQFGEEAAQTPQFRAPRIAPARGPLGVGCLGAGGFARGVLLPALRTVKEFAPRVICSGHGLSAVTTQERLGFERVAADENEVLHDPSVHLILALTRHDQHARQVVAAWQAGKHVFVEKPLAITIDEVARIEEALASLPDGQPGLLVGFNRRFSPAANAVKQFFGQVDGPLTVSFRFNAGAIPREHWCQDEQVGGGRIIGEACHAIDLATYLAGSPVVRVYAESIGGPRAPRVTDDQCFITLRHANGSVASVAYLAGGDKACPKERIEVFGGGRAAVIDDFCRAEGWASGRHKVLWRARQDKGHGAELRTFAKTLVAGGDWPISWPELRATTLAAILAVRSLREGVPFEIPMVAAEEASKPLAA